MLRHALGFAALALLAVGCVDSEQLGSDCDADGGCRALHQSDASGAVGTTLPFEPEALTGIASVDLLFVIDDSPGMGELQAALAARVPALVEQLLRGDLDGGGFPEFHPMSEVRAAVVAANRGVGSALAPDCTIHPPGVLTTRHAAPGCMGTHPALLRYASDGMEAPGATLACAVQLGGNGCGVSQPLEAMLEGLGALQTAHGGVWADDSVQLVVVLTDQEDCSTDNLQLLAPDAQLDAADPLRGVPDALRCVRNPGRLAGVLRYSQGLQGLRPGQSNRVLFVALGGFPDDRVSPAAYDATGFGSTGARSQFFGALMGDPRMSYGDALGSGGRVGDACAGTMREATPARRLADLAQALQQQGRVGSVCGDLDAALTTLADLVATRVGLPGL